ncbi:glutathione S-transferase family protein [Jannaschia sp. W003]|uniref:glutathione S-transferase family protein n=1 Tax=Jannaschia sp. W003 TaxID=2867012 RepID=UPI0021A581EA|nr:glutathione S-transferase family protein [Jannaschia sp. W003]
MRPLWLLEELGVPYEFVSLMPRSPEALALSPLGKVPILEAADGTVILDSVAQMHFLADVHGGFTHPAGTVARARQDAFTFAVLEMLDANLWTLALHGFGLPEAMRVPEAKPPARRMITMFSTKIADMMDGEHAVGDGPTVADILLAQCTAWTLVVKVDVDPRLRAHMDRMRARPAYARATAHEEVAA